MLSKYSVSSYETKLSLQIFTVEMFVEVSAKILLPLNRVQTRTVLSH